MKWEETKRNGQDIDKRTINLLDLSPFRRHVIDETDTAVCIVQSHMDFAWANNRGRQCPCQRNEVSCRCLSGGFLKLIQHRTKFEHWR